MTDRRPALLYTGLILVALVAIFHFTATALYLYWTFWWTDVVMHFLAGTALGFVAVWALFYSGLFFHSTKSTRFVIIAVICSVMAAGTAWEIFEYRNGITDSQEGYRKDTMNDLILDGCGATLAALFATRKKNHHA